MKTPSLLERRALVQDKCDVHVATSSSNSFRVYETCSVKICSSREQATPPTVEENSEWPR